MYFVINCTLTLLPTVFFRSWRIKGTGPTWPVCIFLKIILVLKFSNAYDNIFATQAFWTNHRLYWRIKWPHRPYICNYIDGLSRLIFWMRTARSLTASRSGEGAYVPCMPSPCEQNDWQTGIKTLPCRNVVAGGNYAFII